MACSTEAGSTPLPTSMSAHGHQSRRTPTAIAEVDDDGDWVTLQESVVRRRSVRRFPGQSLPASRASGWTTPAVRCHVSGHVTSLLRVMSASGSSSSSNAVAAGESRASAGAPAATCMMATLGEVQLGGVCAPANESHHVTPSRTTTFARLVELQKTLRVSAAERPANPPRGFSNCEDAPRA